MKKIIILFYLIVIFSFVVQAQPGGGGGPGGSGGSGGSPGGHGDPGGGPVGPGGHGGPTGSAGPSRPSGMPGPNGSGSVSGGGPAQKRFEEFPQNDRKVIIQYFINYRGIRKPITQQDLQISNIDAQMIDHKTLRMDISFNQSINPRTVKPDNIKINGKALLPKTRFIFNKKGDCVRFFAVVSEKSVTMNLSDIESYAGSLIDPYEIQMEIQK